MERSIVAGVAAGDLGYVAVKVAFVGVNAVYVLGGLAGSVLIVRSVGLLPVLSLLAFVAYLSLVHSLLFATPRYHVPAIPVLIVFLAYLVTRLAGAWAVRRSLVLGAPAADTGYGTS